MLLEDVRRISVIRADRDKIRRRILSFGDAIGTFGTGHLRGINPRQFPSIAVTLSARQKCKNEHKTLIRLRCYNDDWAMCDPKINLEERTVNSLIFGWAIFKTEGWNEFGSLERVILKRLLV